MLIDDQALKAWKRLQRCKYVHAMRQRFVRVWVGIKPSIQFFWEKYKHFVKGRGRERRFQGFSIRKIIVVWRDWSICRAEPVSALLIAWEQCGSCLGCELHSPAYRWTPPFDFSVAAGLEKDSYSLELMAKSVARSLPDSSDHSSARPHEENKRIIAVE